MKKTASITAAILLSFAAITAGTSESRKPVAVSAVYDGPVSTATVVGAPAHDYKLERESCCGPQQ